MSFGVLALETPRSAATLGVELQGLPPCEWCEQGQAGDTLQFDTEHPNNAELGLNLLRRMADTGLYTRPLLVDAAFGAERALRDLLHRTHKNYLVEIPAWTRLYDRARSERSALDIIWQSSSLGRSDFRRHHLADVEFASAAVSDRHEDILYPASLLWERVPLASGRTPRVWLHGGQEAHAHVLLLEIALRRIRTITTRGGEKARTSGWADYSGRSESGMHNHISLCVIAELFELLG